MNYIRGYKSPDRSAPSIQEIPILPLIKIFGKLESDSFSVLVEGSGEVGEAS